MKRVWKCDFCSSTSKDKKDIIVHEQECSFNPVNKTCYTCDNRVYAMYHGSSDECKIHDFGHFLDVEEEGKICEDWISTKERARKLKQIKNKM